MVIWFCTLFTPFTFYLVFHLSLFQVFPEAESVVVAEPHVVALVSAVAELSPWVVVLVVEPEVVFVSEPQASVDIAVAFVVLVPVSVFVVGVDSPGRPKFLAFPNID